MFAGTRLASECLMLAVRNNILKPTSVYLKFQICASKTSTGVLSKNRTMNGMSYLLINLPV